MERELVQHLAVKAERFSAMRALAGGVNATELRGAVLTDAAFAALCEGVGDPNPRVRWWCIQILDHVPDERAVAALSSALYDSVARVRRNAAHALGCVACKPNWNSHLPEEVLQRLAVMAESDPSAKVRAEARCSLTWQSAND